MANKIVKVFAAAIAGILLTLLVNFAAAAPLSFSLSGRLNPNSFGWDNFIGAFSYDSDTPNRTPTEKNTGTYNFSNWTITLRDSAGAVAWTASSYERYDLSFSKSSIVFFKTPSLFEYRLLFAFGGKIPGVGESLLKLSYALPTKSKSFPTALPGKFLSGGVYEIKGMTSASELLKVRDANINRLPL